MKTLFSLTLAATLLAAGVAQAQTKVKIKDKYEDGAVVKTKRVETLSGIDVFPKPNSNSVLLSFTQQFTKPGTLVITDVQNKVVYQQALDPASNTGAPVDLGHVPAGTYLVEAKTGNYVYWKKVRIKYPASARR